MQGQSKVAIKSLPRTAKAITSPLKLSEYSIEKKKQDTKTTVTNPPFNIVRYFFVFSNKKPTTKANFETKQIRWVTFVSDRPVNAAPTSPQTINTAPNVPASSLLYDAYTIA